MPGLKRSAAPRGAFLMAVLLAAAACGGGDVREAEPTNPTGPGPGSPTDTAGTVQRGSLSVTVTIDPADAAVATALGLNASAPAGLTVRAQRQGAAGSAPTTATTDGTGRAELPGLLEGTYVVSVERTISDSQRAQLAVGDRDVTAIAGGTSVPIRPGTNTASVEAVAGRRGSIIISEIFPGRYTRSGIMGTGGYASGSFLELTNNSDTTIYLDRMLLGHTPPYFTEAPWTTGRCNQFESLRMHPTGLPLFTLFEFPGNGREFPVAPGAQVVIAQDAMDHSGEGPHLVDLSQADWEIFGGDEDIDNAFVPNLPMIRGIPGGIHGRGVNFSSDHPGAWIIAAPGLSQLDWAPVEEFANRGPIPIVPDAMVLDVFGLTSSDEAIAILAASGISLVYCNLFMRPVFERQPARVIRADFGLAPFMSIQRRISHTRADGRVILQRTRTSERDVGFERAATPGRP